MAPGQVPHGRFAQEVVHIWDQRLENGPVSAHATDGRCMCPRPEWHAGRASDPAGRDYRQLEHSAARDDAPLAALGGEIPFLDIHMCNTYMK